MRIFIVKKKNYYDAYNFSLIFNERKKNNQKIVTSFIKGFVSTFFFKGRDLDLHFFRRVGTGCLHCEYPTF